MAETYSILLYEIRSPFTCDYYPRHLKNFFNYRVIARKKFLMTDETDSYFLLFSFFTSPVVLSYLLLVEKETWVCLAICCTGIPFSSNSMTKASFCCVYKIIFTTNIVIGLVFKRIKRNYYRLLSFITSKYSLIHMSFLCCF